MLKIAVFLQELLLIMMMIMFVILMGCPSHYQFWDFVQFLFLSLLFADIVRIVVTHAHNFRSKTFSTKDEE